MAAFARFDVACTFGPSFCLGQLGRFVRDRCPDPNEHLPVVQVHLADGEPLDIHHIIGVSPRWLQGDSSGAANAPDTAVERADALEIPKSP